jgi:hypothetical protein
MISLNLWAQSSPEMDWNSLSDIMNTYQTDGSLVHLRNNVRMFLLSSPVQSLSSTRLNRENCGLQPRIRELIKPELVDILFAEIIYNFPFYEPQKIGCQGFLCSEPIYTIVPNKKNLEEYQKWVDLSRWMQNDISAVSVETDSAYFKKTHAAFKAYTLIQSLVSCRLPKSSFGVHANDYDKVWRAVEYSINPNKENYYPGYTVILGGKDSIEIVELLEVVEKLKSQLPVN